MARFLLLLALAGCTGTDDTGRPPKDSRDTDTAESDADTDADTDTDTDADTDTNTPDLATLDGFVEAHAGTYCGSLEACGFLDEQGYKTKAQCISSVIAFFSASGCTSANYQQAAGEICVRDDRRMADNCETTNNGEEPLACRDVCTPPK